MAHGTPASRTEIEPFYTRIRRGRPPTPEQLADLDGRYEAIGGISPLDRPHRGPGRRGARRARRRAPGRYVVRSAPSTPTRSSRRPPPAGRRGRRPGRRPRPHPAPLVLGSQEYLDRAAAALGDRDPVHAGRAVVRDAGARRAAGRRGCSDALRARRRAAATVIFTAHSLPERIARGRRPLPRTAGRVGRGSSAGGGRPRRLARWPGRARGARPSRGSAPTCATSCAGWRPTMRADARRRLPDRLRGRPPRGPLRPRRRGGRGRGGGAASPTRAPRRSTTIPAFVAVLADLIVGRPTAPPDVAARRRGRRRRRHQRAGRGLGADRGRRRPGPTRRWSVLEASPRPGRHAAERGVRRAGGRPRARRLPRPPARGGRPVPRGRASATRWCRSRPGAPRSGPGGACAPCPRARPSGSPPGSGRRPARASWALRGALGLARDAVAAPPRRPRAPRRPGHRPARGAQARPTGRRHAGRPAHRGDPRRLGGRHDRRRGLPAAAGGGPAPGQPHARPACRGARARPRRATALLGARRRHGVAGRPPRPRPAARGVDVRLSSRVDVLERPATGGWTVRDRGRTPSRPTGSCWPRRPRPRRRCCAPRRRGGRACSTPSTTPRWRWSPSASAATTSRRRSTAPASSCPARSPHKGRRAVGRDRLHLPRPQVAAPRPARRGPAARLAGPDRRHPRHATGPTTRSPTGPGRSWARCSADRPAARGPGRALRRRVPAVPGAPPAADCRGRGGGGPPRRGRRGRRGVPRRRHPGLHRQRPGRGARARCEPACRAGAASPRPRSRRVSCSRSRCRRGAGGPWASSAPRCSTGAWPACACAPASGPAGWPAWAASPSGSSGPAPSTGTARSCSSWSRRSSSRPPRRPRHPGAAGRSPSSAPAPWPRRCDDVAVRRTAARRRVPGPGRRPAGRAGPPRRPAPRSRPVSGPAASAVATTLGSRRPSGPAAAAVHGAPPPVSAPLVVAAGVAAAGRRRQRAGARRWRPCGRCVSRWSRAAGNAA